MNDTSSDSDDDVIFIRRCPKSNFETQSACLAEETIWFDAATGEEEEQAQAAKFLEKPIASIAPRRSCGLRKRSLSVGCEGQRQKIKIKLLTPQKSHNQSPATARQPRGNLKTVQSPVGLYIKSKVITPQVTNVRGGKIAESRFLTHPVDPVECKASHAVFSLSGPGNRGAASSSNLPRVNYDTAASSKSISAKKCTKPAGPLPKNIQELLPTPGSALVFHHTGRVNNTNDGGANCEESMLLSKDAYYS